MKKYLPLIVLCIILVYDRLFFGYDSYNLRFCLYYSGWLGYEWYSPYRIRGKVGATNIRKTATGQEVHIDDICEIVADTAAPMAKMFQSSIYTQKDAQETAMEVSLSGEDLIVLAGKHNNWVIEDETITITTGREEEGRKILFRFLGRHYTRNHIFSIVILAPVLAINENAEFFPYQYVFPLVLILAGEMLKHWRKVAVILEDAGIRVNEGQDRERFIEYGDVAKVEKGFIHTTVTTKTGEVFSFPRAWALLPELIRKFAGL